jgi:hypothetical protein
MGHRAGFAVADLHGLIRAIRALPTDGALPALARLLESWLADDAPVADLTAQVERYLGHTWFADPGVHERVNALWESFRTTCIESLGGMTMNERLHHFGLDSRFDDCEDEAARLVIYHKLHASP